MRQRDQVKQKNKTKQPIPLCAVQIYSPVCLYLICLRSAFALQGLAGGGVDFFFFKGIIRCLY